MKGILGKKIGMTQIFTEEGIVVPVTVVEDKYAQIASLYARFRRNFC